MVPWYLVPWYQTPWYKTQLLSLAERRAPCFAERHGLCCLDIPPNDPRAGAQPLPAETGEAGRRLPGCTGITQSGQTPKGGARPTTPYSSPRSRSERGSFARSSVGPAACRSLGCQVIIRRCSRAPSPPANLGGSPLACCLTRPRVSSCNSLCFSSACPCFGPCCFPAGIHSLCLLGPRIPQHATSSRRFLVCKREQDCSPSSYSSPQPLERFSSSAMLPRRSLPAMSGPSTLQCEPLTPCLSPPSNVSMPQIAQRVLQYTVHLTSGVEFLRGITIAIALSISCFESARSAFPCNLILLFAFTIAEAFLVGHPLPHLPAHCPRA